MKPHDPRMLTVGTAFDAATGDDPAANVGPMQEPTVFNNARARAAARESPSVRTGRRRDPNELDGRSSQMLFFFARCRDRDHNAEARPTATSHKRVTKQHDAAMDTEKPQLARMKNRSEVFRLLSV